MGKRRSFSRDFKVSLLRELENGRSMGELCRMHAIHPSLLSKWRQEYNANPKEAFSGRGNICKLEAKLAERERLIGELYAETAFLRKALSALEAKLADYRQENGGRSCTQ